MPVVGDDGQSRSGITTNTSGERHIPSSVRADGTVRKEIKVRPGYRPPEDVEVYRNRAASAWKSRGSGGVPGAEPIAQTPQPTSSASKKNAKRKEARKNAAGNLEPHLQTEAELADTVESEPLAEATDPEAEKEKEAKKLAKKLRQARDLQQKKEKGDALLPEQFAKVIKMNELLRQLDQLGFNAEGERKETAAAAPEDE